MSVTDNELSFIKHICLPEGLHSSLTLLHRAGVNSVSGTGVNTQIRIMLLYQLSLEAPQLRAALKKNPKKTAITIPKGQILCKDALRKDRNTIHKVIILSLPITATHLLHVTCQAALSGFH